ncbi:MAG: thiamine phosphate synthase [Peptostreptococcus sp.]|uniref:thiamine phosphate synthase n=1 Tax=Peptostreptococcus sp. TaxID=1262 RepID=UPI002FCAC424
MIRLKIISNRSLCHASLNITIEKILYNYSLSRKNHQKHKQVDLKKKNNKKINKKFDLIYENSSLNTSFDKKIISSNCENIEMMRKDSKNYPTKIEDKILEGKLSEKETFKNYDFDDEKRLKNQKMIDFLKNFEIDSIVLREKDLNESDYKNLYKEILDISSKYNMYLFAHSYYKDALYMEGGKIHLPLYIFEQICNKIDSAKKDSKNYENNRKCNLDYENNDISPINDLDSSKVLSSSKSSSDNKNLEYRKKSYDKKSLDKFFECYKEIGVSVHSIDEAKRAESLGASYLTFGHIFETDCKKGLEPRGLKLLKELCSSVAIPIYAIGGITPQNAYLAVENGAKGVCIMSGIMKL